MLVCIVVKLYIFLQGYQAWILHVCQQGSGSQFMQ